MKSAPPLRYTLSYIETAKGVEKGDSVMQIGVGSGERDLTPGERIRVSYLD